RAPLVTDRVARPLASEADLPPAFLRPPQHRIDFYQAELGVPLDALRGLSVLGLLPADGADPRRVAPHCPPQGQHLAVVATLVRAVNVQRPAVLAHVLGNRRVRADVFNRDAVPLADALPQLQVLGDLLAGVQVDDPDGRL